MKWLALILGITAMICCSAGGQTTQPSEQLEATWNAAIADFTSALTNGDENAVNRHLASTATIRNFESDSPQAVKTLLKFTVAGAPVSSHIYLGAPSELATQLAEDFKNAENVSEALRRQMTPNHEGIERANATAMQWINRTLAPLKDQPVAVIVCRPDPIETIGPSATVNGPMFILVKGDATADGYHIKQIIFGNPIMTN